MSSLSDWLVDNKLSLHLGKTETLLFGSKAKLRKCKELKVSCNGIAIAAKSSVTYLGAILQQDLSGELMADMVLKKVNNKLKFLYRQCRQFDSDIKKTLVNALIICHFDYTSASWYSALTVAKAEKLQTAQNKLVRFVFSLGPRTHIEPYHFKKLNWLPISTRVLQLKLNHMYKIFHRTAPSYLLNITRAVDIHQHQTRKHTYSFFVPTVKSACKRSFFYTGLLGWNDLPLV